jgi:hypothetical protein
MRDGSRLAATTCLVLALTMFAVIPAAAQYVAPSPPAVTVGVKGGINLGNLSFSTDTGQYHSGHLRAGLIGGAFVTYPVAKSLAFETDVLVAVKGTRDGDEHIKITYLEIPVLLRLVDVKYGDSRLHLFVGPSLDFKLAASDDLSPLSRVVFGGHSVADATRGFDPGLTFSGDITTGRTVVDFRYTWGLIDIGNSLTPATGTIKNRALTIMFGYRLGK